jgi:outer membrane lipoprotein SlyB
MRLDHYPGPRSIVCVVLSVILVIVGCAGPTAGSRPLFDEPGRAALICGAGGAATGAAIGAAIGGGSRRSTGATLTGALIGATVGGLLGAATCFAIAEYRSREVKTYDETREAVRYEPAQGDVVRITQYMLTPAAAAPGTEVGFAATYYVMTADAAQEVQVTETRVVEVRDPATGQYRELGKVATPVTARPGTRQADGKFQVRSGVAEGTYRVIFEVAKNGVTDRKALPLVVTKDQAVLTASESRVAQAVEEATKSVPAPAGGRSDATAPAGTGTAAPPATPLAALGEQEPAAPQTAGAPQGSSRVVSSYFVAAKVVGLGNVREGPGTSYKIIGQIKRGERFPIVARDAAKDDGTVWYRIRLEDGREGWVASGLGEEVHE